MYTWCWESKIALPLPPWVDLENYIDCNIQLTDVICISVQFVNMTTHKYDKRHCVYTDGSKCEETNSVSSAVFLACCRQWVALLEIGFNAFFLGVKASCYSDNNWDCRLRTWTYLQKCCNFDWIQKSMYDAAPTHRFIYFICWFDQRPANYFKFKEFTYNSNILQLLTLEPKAFIINQKYQTTHSVCRGL